MSALLSKHIFFPLFLISKRTSRIVKSTSINDFLIRSSLSFKISFFSVSLTFIGIFLIISSIILCGINSFPVALFKYSSLSSAYFSHSSIVIFNTSFSFLNSLYFGVTSVKNKSKNTTFIFRFSPYLLVPNVYS